MAVFLSTISPFSHDASERRETVAVCAEDRSQSLVGAVWTQFLPRPEMLMLGKKQKPSGDDSNQLSQLKRRVQTKPARPHFGLPPARPDLGLPPATSSRKQSNKNCRGENFERVKTVTETGSEKVLRYERPLSAEGAWKRSPPSVSTSLTLLQVLPKRGELRPGQFEDSVPETVPVKYEM